MPLSSGQRREHSWAGSSGAGRGAGELGGGAWLSPDLKSQASFMEAESWGGAEDGVGGALGLLIR